MAVNLSALAGAGQQFFDNNGAPLSGGKLYSYAAGTTTLQSTYTSASGSTAHSNPIILDSAGRVATGEIWLTAGSNYKFVLKTSADVSLATWDNITGINGTGITSNASNVTYDPVGTGAVPTTVQAKLRESVSVKDFGAVGNGVTDDTAAIQNAINAASNVYVPAGTYMCGNILMKSNLRITGESTAAILKLLPNATTYSINGSQADTNGRYPGNVICSTLTHTGGTYYDGGTRAKNPDNAVYIYENIVIENLTIDGNKVNNQVGDVGLNASAMGAGVNVMLCKNVTVQNCNLINNRLEGVFIGYSLCGGSDYCNIVNNNFSGNQRTNIALVTGKYNSVLGNTGTAPTAGTGVNYVAALDIEANLVDEVNWRHTIANNRLGGNFAIVAPQPARQNNIVVSNNVWLGRLSLGPSPMTGGCVIDGDTYIANVDTENWLNRAGTAVLIQDMPQTIIRNCVVSGFEDVLTTITQGGAENFSVTGCTLSTKAFGGLVRAYNVAFENNSFYFAGSADSQSIFLSNTLGGTITNQGRIKFNGNSFYGTSNATFLYWSRDLSWAANYDDLMFANNTVNLSGATTTFKGINVGATIKNNNIVNFAPIDISGISTNFLNFVENSLTATTTQFLFTGQSSYFSNAAISNNSLSNISINLQRPKDVIISSNRIVNGNIVILYSFTTSGVGRSFVSFNKLTSTTSITNPFVVTTGVSFSTGDFVGNDQYFYNTYVGYTSGASIAAAMTGVYNGTFA